MEFQDLQKLLQTFDSSNISRLQYSSGAVSISLEKSVEGADCSHLVNIKPEIKETHNEPMKMRAVLESVAAETIQRDKIASENIVSAPMVGVYYSAPSPEATPYVKVGQTVQKGQTLCILEAMKVMNEIQAEWDGKVEAILIEPEQIVEFGQPMFHIRRD